MQVTGTQDTRELTAQPEPPCSTEGGGGGITAQLEVLELVWGDTRQLFRQQRSGLQLAIVAISSRPISDCSKSNQ